MQFVHLSRRLVVKNLSSAKPAIVASLVHNPDHDAARPELEVGVVFQVVDGGVGGGAVDWLRGCTLRVSSEPFHSATPSCVLYLNRTPV